MRAEVLGRQVIRGLRQPVLVVPQLRFTDAAERRRPRSAAGGDVAEKRAADLIAQRCAAADDRKILFAPLALHEEVARQNTVVVEGGQLDQVPDGAKACKVDDVAE